MLSECRVLHCDGTFKTCPKPFKQVCTIAVKKSLTLQWPINFRNQDSCAKDSMISINLQSLHFNKLDETYFVPKNKNFKYYLTSCIGKTWVQWCRSGIRYVLDPWIRDGDSSNPGSGVERCRIRDKHPGSATLHRLGHKEPRGKINTAILTCFQIYVIQGRYRGRIIPLAFALMKTRRAGCYKRVWEVLAEKTLAVTTKVLAPRKIVTDFEVKLLTWFT